MTIIVSGTIGRSGLGGQAWAVLQYLLGFRALGHDVYYLEDCGVSSWVYDWDKAEWTTELDYPASYVRACLEPFGLGDRWIYRTDDGSAGMPLEDFVNVCARADLLIMRAVPLWVWRAEYDKPARRAFLDVDPGFTQISIAENDKGFVEGIARAEKRFTVAQRIGQSDCEIPSAGGPWISTLPTVYLPEWPKIETEGANFTSIIRWQGFREANHDGKTYGQRDKEFPKYIDLPSLTQQQFCLAMMGTKPETLTRHGWGVAPGEIVSKTPGSYRSFIQESRGEFSVPKEGYVRMRGGWFSDRSVCYLASGRPVVIADTGISESIETGRGLLTFTDLPQAIDRITSVNADYRSHATAARALAEHHFSTDRVLPKLIDDAMN